jgi:DnaJ-class molecular chaperone
MGLYEEITRAREILGLPELATIKRIKKSFNDSIKRWHPDRCREKKEICREKSAQLIQAYKTIMKYCDNYRFSFSRDEVDKYISAEETWKKKYGSDPIWSADNE